MSLTVGICAFNEERNIESLLRNVLSQSGLPQYVQVIVVASGCTDKTPMIVREIARHDNRVQLVEEKTRSGKAHAVNQLLARCHSEFLAIIDADIRLAANCINEIMRGFSSKAIGVVGALPIVGNFRDGIVATSASLIWRLMRRTLTELSLGSTPVIGQAYCFRTSLVQRIPEDTVNDDAYVATYARNRGMQVILALAASYVTRVPSSVSDYIAQRRRVTYGHLQIKAQTGRYAASLEGIALDHPILLAKAMLQETAFRPSSIIRALLILQLECVARLLAWLDFNLGREYVTWKRIETTK